jgi:hypothetical protein
MADSRFLARVGNIQTATRIAGWTALALVGLVVGAFAAIQHIATGWLVLIALGLFGLLFEVLRWVARRRAQRRLVAEPTQSAEQPPPRRPRVGIRFTGNRALDVSGNYVEGYEEGYSFEDNEEVRAQGNVAKRRPDSAPKLTVAIDPLRPVHRRREPKFGGLAYFPEVVVENVGATPAEGVEAALVEWKYGDRRGLFRDHPDFGEPRPLEPPERVDLHPGGKVRLSLGWASEWDDKESILHLFAHLGKPIIPEGSHPQFRPGTYRAKVRVTATGLRPVEALYELQFDAWDRLSFYPVES